jgi:uncharacterized protein YbjT (DUF2867 family)
MKVLLTGSNGYIGKRLLPVLLAAGHQVVCSVRDRKRFPVGGVYSNPNISVLEVDFLKDPIDHPEIKDIDAAYYLIHSMSDRMEDFDKLEEKSAKNFVKLITSTNARQIIYLGGIINQEKLSKHLASRAHVDTILRSSGIPVTTLKAGIIVGSGSSSFEIIRDLVEKLPLMITPRWLNTRTQPIAVRNVLQYLSGVLGREETFNNSYDIGGPDILTYKQMLMQLAELRKLKRLIITLPVMTPRLSSYWLYFVTATSYKLAVNLVNSMKVEVVATPNNLNELLGIKPMTYREALSLAIQRVEQNAVVSSWKDAFVSSTTETDLFAHVEVPINGCFTDRRVKDFTISPDRVLQNIWSIGGDRGWYYGYFLWRLRGILDKFVGGPGLRRGRTNATEINPGDTLDFWRVLVADKADMRLLLYAEMKLPGEAWLEFRIRKSGDHHELIQTATFRPVGLLGRLYWYSVLPFHFFVFDGMATNLILQEPKFYGSPALKSE